MKEEFVIKVVNTNRYYVGTNHIGAIFSPEGVAEPMIFALYGAAEATIKDLDVSKHTRLTIEKHFVKQ